MNIRLKREKGFTLVEVLITIVILGLGMLALVRMLSLGIFSDVDIENRMIALSLATEKMEELVSFAKDHTDLNAGTHTDPNNPVRTTFTRFWSVTDDDPVADMKRIEVWVTYPHGSETREARLTTHRRG